MKQDPVSEVTLCVGILFFLVTGRVPRQLQDQGESMPHQRSDLPSDFFNNPEHRFLRRIFDKGFRHRVDERFASVKELQDALQNRPEPGEDVRTKTIEQVIGDLDEVGEAKARARQQNCESVIQRAHSIARATEKKLNGVYVYYQTGHETAPGAVRTQVGFALGNDHSMTAVVPFEASVVGSEIVVTDAGRLSFERRRADLGQHAGVGIDVEPGARDSRSSRKATSTAQLTSFPCSSYCSQSHCRRSCS
jgi:hypothetical protein